MALIHTRHNYFPDRSFFFVKQEVPEDQCQALDFAKKLAPLGMSLPAYQALFMQENEER